MKTSFVVLLLCVSACFARSLPVVEQSAELTALQRDWFSDLINGIHIGTQVVNQLGQTLIPIIGVLGKRDASEAEIAMLRDWLSDLLNIAQPIISTIPTIISLAGLLGKRDVSQVEAQMLRDWFSDFLSGVQIGTQIIGQIGQTLIPVIGALGKRDLASEALLRGWLDDILNAVNQVTGIVTQILPVIDMIAGKRDVSEAELALARDFWSDFAAGFQQGFFGVLNVAQQILPSVLPIITAVGKRDASEAEIAMLRDWLSDLLVIAKPIIQTLPTIISLAGLLGKRDVSEAELALARDFWSDFAAGFQQGFFGVLNVAQQILPSVLPIITAVGKRDLSDEELRGFWNSITNIVKPLLPVVVPILIGKRDASEAEIAMLRDWLSDLLGIAKPIISTIPTIISLAGLLGKRDVSEAELALARDFWSDFAAGFQQGFFGALNVAQQLLPAVLPIITAVGKRDAKFVLPEGWAGILPILPNWNTWPNIPLVMSKRDASEAEIAMLRDWLSDLLSIAQPIISTIPTIISLAGLLGKRDISEVDMIQLKGFWSDFSTGFQQGFFGVLNVAQQILPAVLPIITAVGK